MPSHHPPIRCNDGDARSVLSCAKSQAVDRGGRAICMLRNVTWMLSTWPMPRPNERTGRPGRGRRHYRHHPSRQAGGAAHRRGRAPQGDRCGPASIADGNGAVAIPDCRQSRAGRSSEAIRCRTFCRSGDRLLPLRHPAHPRRQSEEARDPVLEIRRRVSATITLKDAITRLIVLSSQSFYGRCHHGGRYHSQPLRGGASRPEGPRGAAQSQRGSGNACHPGGRRATGGTAATTCPTSGVRCATGCRAIAPPRPGTPRR